MTLPAAQRKGDLPVYSFDIPLRTINSLNVREHWAKRAKRAKRERAAACLLSPAGIKQPRIVCLTRVAPRMMDGDGLQASLKNIRDGIADKLGVDDGSDSLRWEYAQMKSSKPRHYAVHILIVTQAAASGS